MPTQDPFPWISFYRELAQKLLQFWDKQNQLIDWLKEAGQAGTFRTTRVLTMAK